MHNHGIESHRHEHVFLADDHVRNERRTWSVIALTLTMMVAEIAAGYAFGSMALLADGWHMGTHAAALGITAGAYLFARRYARDERFTFGTGKIGDLAAFASALFLGATAAWIGWESLQRLARPVPIAFDQAIGVAVIGLAVNLVSAWLLSGGHEGGHGHGHGRHRHAQGDEQAHEGGHGHGHGHGHRHAHQDQNLRAAYMHVLADALTSVLAIVALLFGRYLGWNWMDPAMGAVGAIIIGRWSWGLLRSTSAVLVDANANPLLAAAVRQSIEGGGGDRISDLHLWRIGPGAYAAIVAIVSAQPRSPDAYKAKLAHLPQLAHITVEPQACPHGH